MLLLSVLFLLWNVWILIRLACCMTLTLVVWKRPWYTIHCSMNLMKCPHKSYWTHLHTHWTFCGHWLDNGLHWRFWLLELDHVFEVCNSRALTDCVKGCTIFWWWLLLYCCCLLIIICQNCLLKIGTWRLFVPSCHCRNKINYYYYYYSTSLDVKYFTHFLPFPWSLLILACLFFERYSMLGEDARNG